MILALSSIFMHVALFVAILFAVIVSCKGLVYGMEYARPYINQYISVVRGLLNDVSVFIANIEVFIPQLLEKLKFDWNLNIQFPKNPLDYICPK